jgi:pyrimidine deaminase RibD-like protein
MTFNQYFDKLQETAKKSSILHKHGAVVIKNGKALSWGFNSIVGLRPCHAEIDAIKKYLISKGMLGYVSSRRILWGPKSWEREQRIKCAPPYEECLSFGYQVEGRYI